MDGEDDPQFPGLPENLVLHTARFRDRPHTDPQTPQFGADPTGQSDSTAAIVAAMQHAASTGAGIVRLGDGVFRVAPKLLCCLPIPPGLQLFLGAGQGRTTILVADGVGHYESVFASNGSDVSGLSIANLTIDQGDNQIGDDTAPLFQGKPRYAIYLTRSCGDNIIEDVSFRRIAGVNTIAITGLSRRARIHACTFSYLANQTKDYDHSSIYINTPSYADGGTWITDNVFTALTAARGARTAIETHGGHQVVSGNQGWGVQKFMNISGVTTAPSVGTHVFANSCSGCKFGINLWSWPYSTNQGPIGLANVHIYDNTLRLNGPAWKDLFAGSGYANGILLNAQSTLRVENLAIHHNQIIFATAEETGYPGAAGDTIASGIEYKRALLDPACVDQNVSICDNTIIGATANGIRLCVLGTGFDISRNTIINPGAGSLAAGGQMSDGSANGIMINGALTHSRVNANRILDTRVAPAVNIGVHVLPTAPGSADNELIDNLVPTANNRRVELASGWLLRMDQPTVSLPTGPASVGSELRDRTSGRVYRQTSAPEGTTWTSYVPGRVAPSDLVFALPGVLALPGTAGNYLSTPAVAAMDVKAAFRLRVDLSLEDYETTTYLLTRWSCGVTLWNLYLCGGRVHLAAMSGAQVAKSGPLNAVANQRLMIEAVVTPAAGTVTFSRSLDGGDSWTALATTSNTIGGAFALPAASGVALGLGGFAGASGNWLKGKVHAAEYHDLDLAAPVARLDLSQPAAEMLDAQGNPWTVHGCAWTITTTMVGSVNGLSGAVQLPRDGLPTTPSLRSLGVGPQQAARGDDPRFAALPTRAAVVGTWIHLSGQPFMVSPGTGQKLANVWHYMATKFAANIGLSALGICTTVAAASGTAIARLGLFALDSAGRPAARLADWGALYGSIDLTSAPGPKSLATPGLIIPAGEYAIGWAWSGTAKTPPTLSTLLGMHPSIGSDMIGANTTAHTQNISGASVPATATPGTAPSAGVIVWGKLA